ncbi:class I SAM-dependent methyltransferase [Streptomyces atriruber]|uniref:Class I SAM-dependent methyltransferase n=1 Tax=Streptomyces atriruber TaxID=545121 RepID=A0ABV3BX23_9ACTN
MEETNVFYRDPALYDAMQEDSDSAEVCRALIERHHPQATMLIDFGCGTGRDLEVLAKTYTCVGVDLQTRLVDYAHRVRPDLAVRVGDMRNVCLDRTADVLVCLGNSLAYVHDNSGIRAVFRTFARHAHTDTLLVICSPVAPIVREQPQTVRMRTAHGPASVAIRYAWDLETQINTMQRHWVFDSGDEAHDVIRRRVLGPRELELHASLAGFEVVEFVDESGSGRLAGPGAYVVARHIGRSRAD